MSKIKNRVLAALALLCATSCVSAQTTREIMVSDQENCAGLYIPYPDSAGVQPMTPPPSGFSPFYISHYGRHGSRYLPAEQDYYNVLMPLLKAASADNLTGSGRELLERVNKVCDDARGRAGELTPMGYRQHRDIAERMHARSPEVFSDDACVTAVSSVYMRCAHSMFAFIGRLKELNADLNVPMESSQRNMAYINPLNDDARKYYDRESFKPKFDAFRKKMINSRRLVDEIFTEPSLTLINVNEQDDFMWALYLLAIDVPNTEADVNLYDFFTNGELFNLWQVFNYEYYTKHSCNPDNGGVFLESIKPLLANILSEADRYIAAGEHGATLRFGHDSALIPLASLLGFQLASGRENRPEELYKTYTDYRVSPMGANIQLLFYRNATGEVLVKFLFNENEVGIGGLETDIFPYYRWCDLRPVLGELVNPRTHF
ncbi:MAG: histidine phosphatase family protein [Clostridiales bacterium]|nr:histidine phosphatase family protein [Clostridiales bacterium]